jgi:hypothetical protein
MDTMGDSTDSRTAATVPAVRPLRSERIGVSVTCVVCGWGKQPMGRSAPLGWAGCRQDDCAGYRMQPYPGSLWPGESEADFGYHVGAQGTTDASGEVAR